MPLLYFSCVGFTIYGFLDFKSEIAQTWSWSTRFLFFVFSFDSAAFFMLLFFFFVVLLALFSADYFVMCEMFFWFLKFSGAKECLHSCKTSQRKKALKARVSVASFLEFLR